MLGVAGKAFLDLDQHIDIAGLKSLEDEIIEGIVRANKKIVFFYGPGCVLEKEHEGKVKHLGDVYLEIEKRPEEYQKLKKKFPDPDRLREYLGLLNRSVSYSTVVSLREITSGGYEGTSFAKNCTTTKNAALFPGLMSFAKKLPLKEIGRLDIFLSHSNIIGHLHSDGIPSVRTRLLHEFIWMRPNLDKKFYVYDKDTCVKNHVRSHSAFFNSLDQHGSDPTPFTTFSVRVDGVFTDEFKRKINLTS